MKKPAKKAKPAPANDWPKFDHVVELVNWLRMNSRVKDAEALEKKHKL